LSYSVDANILLYASDRSSPHHAMAAAFLESRVEDPDLFCVCWTTLIAYLRIATHPRIFANPLSPEEAMSNVESLIALPRVRLLSEDEGFFDVYRDVSGQAAVRGNLVPDAHLAALLRQHGVGTIYTADADFRRFDFLRVQNPIERSA
jgi:toxin-antitoxin system PIN domain toxin